MKATSRGNILPRRSYLGLEQGQKIELQIKRDKKYGVVYNKILLFKMQLVRAIIYTWKGKTRAEASAERAGEGGWKGRWELKRKGKELGGAETMERGRVVGERRDTRHS